MNRIDEKFSYLKSENKKAVITFLTAGDPDIETTKRTILEMEERGADLIEIGVPFSDPIAETPAVQEANIRALANNINLEIIMDMIISIREITNIPIVYLMYYNSILSFGVERFFEKCAKVGIDGVIIPDLPYDEREDIDEYTKKYGVYQISMIAHTSTPDRIEKIAKKAKGFIYCIAPLDLSGIKTLCGAIEKFSTIPKCIASEAYDALHIIDLKKYCDGLIVDVGFLRRTTV